MSLHSFDMFVSVFLIVMHVFYDVLNMKPFPYTRTPLLLEFSKPQQSSDLLFPDIGLSLLFNPRI